jgi:hypothetical protein
MALAKRLAVTALVVGLGASVASSVVSRRDELPHGDRLVVAQGAPPVRVRWVHRDYVEAVAAHDGTVYIVGGEVHAVDARTGATKWSYGSRMASHWKRTVVCASAWVPGGSLEVFAPYNFDLLLNPTNGRQRRLRHNVGEAPPVTFHEFRRPIPTAYHVTIDGEGAVARRNGRVEWRVAVGQSWVDPSEPIQVGKVIVLPLGSGDVIAVAATSRRRTT